MAVFKCKMCGGALEIGDETIVTCEFCGTKQTLPRLDEDKRINMYDRANHFRRNNEFDKAMAIYEQILNEDKTDAEAYWSLVLCRYGIEYVEDPASHKRVPTVNRAQFTSVFDDSNYKSALQYADSYQYDVYEEEAKAINEIQKGILAISQKEDPFDVFICYKETDNNGRRTPDSVLANELYHQLTQEGFKVFFARITLEDKLGSAYEPYIFAALNSAKAMVVLGTKPEFFNAVWVKNEWSRYLSLIKNGAKKTLIPAYKDMDPYDLPEEFSHLQALDMSKLGFMQDLIRGIKKIVQADESKVAVVKETVVTGGNANIGSLLKRVFMFLEDGDWDNASDYCEKVLDIDPECAEAYLGKLMHELRCHVKNDLKNCALPFNESNNYKKIIRFADDSFKNEINSIIDHINERNNTNRLRKIYDDAMNQKTVAASVKDYLEVSKIFESLGDFLDAKSQAEGCEKLAKEHDDKIAFSISAVDKYIRSGTETSRLEQAILEAENNISELITANDEIFQKLDVSSTEQAMDRIIALKSKAEDLDPEKLSFTIALEEKKAELDSQDLFAIKKKHELNKEIKGIKGNILLLEERQKSLLSEVEEIDSLIGKRRENLDSIEALTTEKNKSIRQLDELRSGIVTSQEFTDLTNFLYGLSYNDISRKKVPASVASQLSNDVFMQFPLDIIADADDRKIIDAFTNHEDENELYELACIIRRNKAEFTKAAKYLVYEAARKGHIPAMYEWGVYLTLTADAKHIVDACKYLEVAAEKCHKDAACRYAEVMLGYIKLDEDKLIKITDYLKTLRETDATLYEASKGAALMKKAEGQLKAFVKEREQREREEARKKLAEAKKAAKEAKKYSSYSSSYDSCACNGSGGCY